MNKNNKDFKGFISINSIYKDKDWFKFKNKPNFPLGYKILSPIDNLIVGLENSYFNFLIGGKGKLGKNNFFHCAIINLLETSKKEKLKFIIIGNKKSELTLYKKLPNLLFPIVTDFEQAKEAIEWCLCEINRRLQLSENHPGTFNEYNEVLKEKMPRIVVVIEELDELMKDNNKFYKDALDRINMFSSSVNINFIVGVSKPSETKLMTKKMIRSFFYRIALATSNSNDSILLVGKKGAKKLKNKNEMLYNYGSAKKNPIHLGGFSIDKDEIIKTISSLT